MNSTRNTAPKAKRGSRFKRHRIARLMAVQAVYEANFHQKPYDLVCQTFLSHRFDSPDYPVQGDQDLFVHLMTIVENRTDQLQDILKASLVKDWTPDRIDPVVRAILMVGIAELFESFGDQPKPVVIMEYIQICDGFFDPKESGYINKVLDTVLSKL